MVQHCLDRDDEVVGVCREQSTGKLGAFKGKHHRHPRRASSFDMATESLSLKMVTICPASAPRRTGKPWELIRRIELQKRWSDVESRFSPQVAETQATDSLIRRSQVQVLPAPRPFPQVKRYVLRISGRGRHVRGRGRWQAGARPRRRRAPRHRPAVKGREHLFEPLTPATARKK